MWFDESGRGGRGLLGAPGRDGLGSDVEATGEDGALHDYEEPAGDVAPDVGALLAQQWGLPDSVHRAIQFHHTGSGDSEADPIVLLVRHTNLFTHAVSEGATDPPSAFGCELQQFLGVQPEALAELLAFAQQAQAGIVL